MTGYVIDHGGTRRALPPLLSWRFLHTDGDGADSFSLTFVFAARWEPILKTAVYFQGTDKGETRFYGIVDEYEVTLDREGLLVTVMGRGMAGRLMDNQMAARDYTWVSLQNILEGYVYPYGITQVRYDENWSLGAYSVPYGATAWQVLRGFCRWSAGVEPRFSPDGTLVLSAGQGARKTLSQPGRVRSARFSCCRYGVYSAVAAKSTATGQESWVENPGFQALGGRAVGRMTIPKYRSCGAARVSPSQMLWDSAAEFRVLELELSTLYSGAPGDVVSLALPKLGLSGEYRVKEAENRLDPEGTCCRLKLAEI